MSMDEILSDEHLTRMRKIINEILNEIAADIDRMNEVGGLERRPGIPMERADAACSAYQWSAAAVRARLMRQP